MIVDVFCVPRKIVAHVEWVYALNTGKGQFILTVRHSGLLSCCATDSSEPMNELNIYLEGMDVSRAEIMAVAFEAMAQKLRGISKGNGQPESDKPH